MYYDPLVLFAYSIARGFVNLLRTGYACYSVNSIAELSTFSQSYPHIYRGRLFLWIILPLTLCFWLDKIVVEKAVENTHPVAV